MGEQAQWNKKVENNPHYQNRERDQRGEDDDVWRIAGGSRSWPSSRVEYEFLLLLRPNQFRSDPVIV